MYFKNMFNVILWIVTESEEVGRITQNLLRA